MGANQGKYAEGKVRTFLEECKQKVTAFTYNRILDAHSARGMMSNPQPGDFQWFMDTGIKVTPGGVPSGAWPEDYQRAYTRNGLIEVKQVAHEYRLPFKNFSADQVGRMRIRQLAGSECIVLVCHKFEGQRGAVWRQVPMDFFRERPGPEYGSWDLREFDAATECGDFLQPYLFP